MRDNQKMYVPVGEGIINYQAIFEKIYATHLQRLGGNYRNTCQKEQSSFLGEVYTGDEKNNEYSRRNA